MQAETSTWELVSALCKTEFPNTQNTGVDLEGRGRDLMKEMSDSLLRQTEKNRSSCQFFFPPDGFERHSWLYKVVTET